MADERVGLDAVLGTDEWNRAMEVVGRGMDTLVSKSESTAKKSSKSFVDWGNIVSTAVGTASGFLIDKLAQITVDGFKGMIDSAAEAQEIESQLNAVLESTGRVSDGTKDAVLDLASAFAKQTKFEDDAIVSAEAVLLRFKDLGKDVLPDATMATLDLATALKMDAGSAAKLLGKALEDPATGINKLRTAGVDLTDEQEKMVESMVKVGDKAGAQKLILDELSKSIGGSAVAAGKTFSGQLTILQNDLGNVFEEIGTDLLPILIELAKEGKDELIPMIKADLLPAVKDFTSFLSGEGVPALKAYFEAFGEMRSISKEWGGLFNEMRGAARTSENGMVQDASDNMLDLAYVIRRGTDHLKDINHDAMQVIRTGWKAWDALMLGDLTEFTNSFNGMWTKLWDSILTAIGLDVPRIRETVQGLFNSLLQAGNDFASGFYNVGTAAISNIVNGLYAAAHSVVDALSSIINQAIAEMLKTLGLGSLAPTGSKLGFGPSSYSMPSMTGAHASNVNNAPVYNTAYHLHISSNLPSVRLSTDFGILKSLASS